MIEYEPLHKHTSWRIGGPARYYKEVSHLHELPVALDWAHQRGLPVFVLGGGANLLVLDSGFPGLVLRYTARQRRVIGTPTLFQEGAPSLAGPHVPSDLQPEPTSIGAEGWLYVEAGAPMAGTVRRTAALGWSGLEWAEGLPGTIGGAIYGNAGCYGGDIASTLERAWLLHDGRVQEWPVARFEYSYRMSVLKIVNMRDRSLNRDNQSFSLSTTPLILAAEFRLAYADVAELNAKMTAIATERKGKTPWGSSCGSVFKNPPGASAGWLIEQTGLKGTRYRAAEISPRHANYIVNLGGAGSDDVLHLIELARSRVLSQFGVELELEIQVIGGMDRLE